MEVLMSKFHAGSVEDFPENSMTNFQVSDYDVLLVHQEGKFYALENKCTHDNNILHDGELLEGKVKCARHGATFDLQTGHATMPAIKKVRLYQTEISKGQIYISYQEKLSTSST